MIEKLQYITQETETLTHIDCVREACISGVKWIQLRVKEKSTDDYLKIAKEARIICDLYDAKLIINDNVEVAVQSGADGIHLGKTDIDPHEARKIIGTDKIIGGTANTIEDVQNLINMGIDYIGLGPFQYTETKKNLSPFLGVEGYYKISQQLFDLLKDSKLNYKVPPIIAIGGIEMDDVSELMKTGINGIAVSGLLTNNFELVEELNKKIEAKMELSF
ncbi:MAG: thiamine phosphate synthase [Flavobacteriales bacterium]|nr:thiamine phosphate synthase [Flavobacteriales bacterium]MCB9335703.1 thiamine phosphate synthase [Flavobacteriales bacterium]